MKWTKSQHDAIFTKGKNIIVSAAAGSGKTAVLIERIYNIVTTQKISVQRLLILTFTNAAAKEMKDRLYEKFSRHLEKKPNDKFIIRQIQNLPLSQISTMHSFCKNSIKENFHHLDIPPVFSIGNESFLGVLKNQAIEEVFAKKYEEDNQDFLTLVDIYSDRQNDDKFIGLILELYENIQNKLEPIQWLESSISSYNVDDFSKTNHFKDYVKMLEENIINYSLSQITQCINLCQNYEELDGYAETLDKDMDILLDLAKTLSSNYDKFIQKIDNIKLPTLKRGKNTKDEAVLELKEIIKEKRNDYKSVLSSKNIYSKTILQTNRENKITYPLLREIVDIVIQFDKIYKKKKKDYDILSFSDLEHNMLSLLKNPDIKKSISDKFDYIFYDEYQDSNTIHNQIIDLIKKEDNLFFVGDVKQSIYGFRNANPHIFIEKYNSYSLDENSVKIDLSENFRSSPQILNFCNFIFKNIMSKDVGDIEYNENSELKSDIDYDYDKNKINITIVEDDGLIDKNEAEASYTAEKIKSLVGKKYFDRKTNDYRVIEYSDIAILFRSPSNLFDIYKKIFKKENIPFYIDGSSSDFDVVEVNLFIDFLKIIDNFMQDDPLIAVMNSMIGGFDIDEITKIKIASQDKYYYKCVLDYSKNNQDKLQKKIFSFIEKINHYNNMEKILSLKDFIVYVLNDSGYLSFINILPGGSQRVKNIDILVKTAEEFEQNRNSSLYFFLIYLDKILKNKSNIFSSKTEANTANMVSLMSIHKSKGLEFPVVFVNSMSTRFNIIDKSSPIQEHANYGIGVNFYDTKLNTKYTTIQRELIKNLNDQKNLSEEMRILYVALTRAKDYLFLTGTVKEEKIDKMLNNEYGNIPINKKNNFLDWIMTPLTKDIENYQNKLYFNFNTYILVNDDANDNQIEKKSDFLKKIDKAEIGENIKNIVSDFDYIYPYENLNKIKIKKSVTQLGEDYSLHHNYKIEPLQDISYWKNTQNVDTAHVGTLVHILLQNIDYKKNYTLSDVSSLAEKLVSKELISPEDKNYIDIDMIYSFLQSDLAKRLSKCEKVYKEQSFITKYEDFILNGVIDLFFIEKDGIILIDFKTDNINKQNTNQKIQHYKSQIYLYKSALEKAFPIPVKESYLYFLKINKGFLI